MSAGFRADGLTHLDEIAAAHVGDGAVPGLVALVARGDVDAGHVHVVTRGVLGPGRAPVARDSLFRITSTSKPIVAAGVMTLVDAGVLGLDEPVDRWLPELATPRVLRRPDGPLDDTVPATRPITVRDLLTFTFGFGLTVDMFLAPEPWPILTAAREAHLNTLGPPDRAEPPDPDTWMARLGTLPLMAQPGERWFYNTAAQVLGVLLARADGAPLPDALHRRVLDPLGMDDTAFWTADTARLATACRPAPDGLEVWDPPEGDWSRPPSFPDAHSGLVSTVDDLLAFARMLRRGGDPVLSPAAVHAMTHDQLTDLQRARDGRAFLDGAGSRSWAFGQSVLLDQDRAGAFGWDGGAGTSWLVDPIRDLVIIVLTQRMFEAATPPAVHGALQAAAYAALA